MDLSNKDGSGLERRGADHLSFHESTIPSDWCLFTPNTSTTVCEGDQPQMGSSSSSSSMAGPFGGRPLWGTAISSHNLSFCDATAHRKPIVPPPRLDMGWNPSEAMPNGGAFLQNDAGILPPDLSQVPTDSAFIERAARFSCFNGTSIGGAVSPFGTNGSSIPFSIAQRNEVDVGEAPDGVSLSVGSTVRTQRGIESSEHGFTWGGQEEAQNSDNMASEPTSVRSGTRKRKRGNQEMGLEKADGDNLLSIGEQENAEGKRKEKQNNSTSPVAKPSGKHGKDNVDAPEDYVHVRARRGQATNSHSLAERVRREKISERMKFLQGLVPGCSKVTGKAVMLDEIINYVQSLQRQVEFLSMKLAAVNPRLDFNIERLLSKEILQSRALSSTTIGLLPDMVHPQLHTAQQAFGQSGFPTIGNPADALRRAINAQITAMNGYREPSNQIPNAWDNELHNVVQVDFTGNAALNIQELHGLPPPGHMKAEP